MGTRRPSRITIRQASAEQAHRLHALIAANREEGHLLPRTLDEITRHAERFVIAVRGRRIVGCGTGAAQLPDGGSALARRRSIGARRRRGHDAGRGIARRGRLEGFDRLCAFTHAPGYFSRMGFSVVPHARLPEKISTDCVHCPRFRRCGQFAMVMALDTAVETLEHERTLGVRH